MHFQSRNLTFGARSHGKGCVTDIRKCLLLPHGRGPQNSASHHFWLTQMKGKWCWETSEVWIKLLNLLESQKNWSLKGWFRFQYVSRFEIWEFFPALKLKANNLKSPCSERDPCREKEEGLCNRGRKKMRLLVDIFHAIDVGEIYVQYNQYIWNNVV